ncbi:MAG: SDR family oxidoreductase [Candidatus Nanoarchaeia archaeon]
MKKKALIVGASGSLGKDLMRSFSADYEVLGTYCSNFSPGLIHLDVTDKKEVSAVFEKEKPDIVIISAAKTNVEGCELNPSDSYKENVEGIQNIINNCVGKKVVFYSTDGVFDGTKKVYFETDESSPINVYGKHKLEAESIVQNIPGSLILRSSRHYGLDAKGKKYLNQVILSLSNGENIKTPINTEGNFTFIPDVSIATLKLVSKNKSGIYNVAGRGIYSLYDAAIEVARVFGFEESLIYPVERDYFNKNVQRPSCPLSLDKLSREGINMKSLNEGLKEIRRIKNG